MKNFLAPLAALILGAICCACCAVEIVVPSGDIQPRELVVLEVRGLTDEQLAMSVVDWSPKDGVQVIPARSWSGSPQVFFSAKQPGKYSLSVKTGVSLSNAIVTAESAKIDAGMVAELKAIVGRIEAAYPPDSTSVTITVAGAPEPPKPDPTPTPVVRGKRKVVILHEQTDDSFAFAALKAGLQSGKNSKWIKENGHQVWILDKDTRDETGKLAKNVQDWLSVVGGAVPSIVIVDESNKVIDSGNLDDKTTPENVVERIKRGGG